MDPASAWVMPAVGSQVDTATMARAGGGTAICLGLSAETAVRSHDVLDSLGSLMESKGPSKVAEGLRRVRGAV